ncbi:MAG: hypothetical protein RMJ48_07535 [Roseiflexaceae bacterium]|nr:hypothetical protein [Roseiflexaceae bacterium]
MVRSLGLDRMGCRTDARGRVLGQVARMTPGTVGEKLYKLRLTFARAILMIGRPSQ